MSEVFDPNTRLQDVLASGWEESDMGGGVVIRRFTVVYANGARRSFTLATSEGSYIPHPRHIN